MVVTALTPAENDKAIAAFGELGVCRQLAEAAAGLGWKTPSSIQTQAIPHLLQGIHICSRLLQLLQVFDREQKVNWMLLGHLAQMLLLLSCCR